MEPVKKNSNKTKKKKNPSKKPTTTTQEEREKQAKLRSQHEAYNKTDIDLGIMPPNVTIILSYWTSKTRLGEPPRYWVKPRYMIPFLNGVPDEEEYDKKINELHTRFPDMFHFCYHWGDKTMRMDWIPIPIPPECIAKGRVLMKNNPLLQRVIEQRVRIAKMEKEEFLNRVKEQKEKYNAKIVDGSFEDDSILEESKVKEARSNIMPETKGGEGNENKDENKDENGKQESME